MYLKELTLRGFKSFASATTHAGTSTVHATPAGPRASH